jgi:hypothetical protein
LQPARNLDPDIITRSRRGGDSIRDYNCIIGYLYSFCKERCKKSAKGRRLDIATLSAAVRKSISSDRLRSYHKVPAVASPTGFRIDPDAGNALARYLWNTALCEALYPTLQAFEVCLRNAVYESLADYYTPDWLTTAGFLRPSERERIRDAEDDILHQGGAVTPGKLVAELTLGFWTGLFVHAYDRSVALPAIQRRLRGYPARIRTRRDLHARFDRARQLRNRVFHYEPIYLRSDLLQGHKDLCDDIGFISPEMGSLVKLQDRFIEVHALGWEHWRGRIDLEILTPVEEAAEEVQE